MRTKVKAGLAGLAGVGVVAWLLPGARLPAPDHPRPFFMGPADRLRLEQAASADGGAAWGFPRVRRAAADGDGYWSAFLYALEGDPRHLATARRWLLDYGRRGGDLGKRALTADDAFFEAGQTWLGDVYYNIDPRPLVAYDWVHDGLSPREREVVEAGIRASARFRIRSLERWTQTPNLVFKPTWMVALAGLSLDDPDLVRWGLVRPPGIHQGGVLSALDVMLRDDGVWGEAPIYPIHHRTLLLTLRLSRWLRSLDGGDWFHHRSTSGGTPQGMIDHYLDTAYPIERTGRGAGQVRIATFGDASTSAIGDLFVVNPAGPGRHMHEELAEAWALSGDPKYAAFLALAPDYRPDPVDHPPLAPASLPPAPSHVWPDFGLVMLRSDDSQGYWTSGDAIAVCHLLTKDYGHAHRDSHSLTLHGAGRLLYPDYNAEPIGYENPGEAWTASTIAHNTLVVDGEDARSAPPQAERHDFAPELKFFASSARGVFAEVTQTRALGLTREYLLDVFFATSPVPRTFDYVLHSFGRPEPADGEAFVASTAPGPRYWRLEGAQARSTAQAWSLDFVLDEAEQRDRDRVDAAARPPQRRRRRGPPPRPGPAASWYDHTATVRLRMAGESGTVVTYGRGAQSVPMLVVRRSARPETTFVATHEPFPGMATPRVTSVRVLAQGGGAVVVEVGGGGFVDVHALVVDPGELDRPHSLRADDGRAFGFRDHAYLRVSDHGRAEGRGGWTGLRWDRPLRSLRLDGRSAAARADGSGSAWGAPVVAAPPAPPRQTSAALTLEAGTVRLRPDVPRQATLRLTNRSPATIAGRLRLAAPAGLTASPTTLTVDALHPGDGRDLRVTLTAGRTGGRHIVPVTFEPTGASPGTGWILQGIEAAVGPVLRRVFRHPEASVYRVDAPGYVAELDMSHGHLVRLEDDAGRVLYAGPALFALADPDGGALDSPGFTWPTESPAYLIAKASNAARWHAAFGTDRITFNMDRDWTQARRTRVTLSGPWGTGALAARWRSAVTAAGPVDARGVVSGLEAAELEVPGAASSLCLELKPAQEARFDGASVSFTVSSLDRDRWLLGACASGSLPAGRNGE